MSSDLRARVVLLSALAFVGCADLERGDTDRDAAVDAQPAADDGGTGDRAAAALSFARDVHKLLLDGCRRCHSTTGNAASTALLYSGDAAMDRVRSMMFVNQERPAGSRLLGKGAGVGHGGGAIYAAGTREYETIRLWIEQGSSP